MRGGLLECVKAYGRGSWFLHTIAPEGWPVKEMAQAFCYHDQTTHMIFGFI